MDQIVPVQSAPADPAEIARLQLAQKKLILNTQLRTGANWFFWIAGLSIINTVIYLFGGDISFIMGLGITQLVDGFAAGLARRAGADLAAIIPIAGLILDVAIAAVFALYAVLGRRRVRWVFIAGMILYALDAMIFVVFLVTPDIAPVIFHLLALWGLFGGFKALLQLDKLEKQAEVAGSGLVFEQANVIDGLESKPQDLGGLILKILAGAGSVMLVLLALAAVYLFLM